MNKSIIFFSIFFFLNFQIFSVNFIEKIKSVSLSKKLLIGYLSVTVPYELFKLKKGYEKYTYSDDYKSQKCPFQMHICY